jgi:DNA-binding transcriptional MerR regulator
MVQTVTASEIHGATGVGASTLRAWRNRNGLFPHHFDREGWTRYEFADAIGVAIMVELTTRGFAAQDAANLVNSMRDQLSLAAQGYTPRVGIGRSPDGPGLEWREIKDTSLAIDALGWFDDPIVIVINLNAICFRLLFSIRSQRGLDPNFMLQAKQEGDPA